MFTLKDLRHLEVMAEISNAQPIPDKEINIRELLSSDQKELGTNEKILSLCAKLRQDGFDKQADGLEDKFMAYKLAGTHLYRAIDEDGEDLINAAHPDGDKDTGNGSGDLGVIETILSKQEKIKKVVNKEPTGKLASYVSKIEKIINKKAQIEPYVTKGLNSAWNLYINIFGTISEQAKEAASKLNSVLRDPHFINYVDLKKSINDNMPKLYKLSSMSSTIEKLLASQSTHAEEIKSTVSDLMSLNTDLSSLLSEISKTMSIMNETKSLKTKIWNTVMNDSVLLDSYNIISHLSESIVELSSSFGMTPTENNKITEINKLEKWKTNLESKPIDSIKKNQMTQWINVQIKELQDSKTDVQVNKVIEENKEFENNDGKGLVNG